MPKQLAPDLTARLQAEIARQPSGAGMDALHATLGDGASRRTLQRRLAELVAEGAIEAVGQARSLKYRMNPAPARVLAAMEPPAEGPLLESLRMSPEGTEIRRLVRLPRAHRVPVSYRQSFLEQYAPNRTAYLPERLREQLHAMGRSPVAEAPAGTFARDILNRLLIDLSWASSHLEGNTYSRLDTERLIAFGQVAPGKDALETQMILNHKAAIEYLVRETEQVAVDAPTVIALHALLSDGLMADPSTCGRLRTRSVEIAGSVYLPIALPQRVEELFGIVLEMAAEIRDPFEQSFFLMVHLPYLQPFEDVNKRVSRLAANISLVRDNLAPLSFLDVSAEDYVAGLLGVYELNRVELLRDVFVQAYERSCQQYTAVRTQMQPPDPLQLRYRLALSDVIAGLVRAGELPTHEAVSARVPYGVAQQDREGFIALCLKELRHLHAGNAIRFGLRPLEMAQWPPASGDSGP